MRHKGGDNLERLDKGDVYKRQPELKFMKLSLQLTLPYHNISTVNNVMIKNLLVFLMFLETLRNISAKICYYVTIF